MLRTTKPPKCKQCRRRLEKIGQVIHEECVDAFVARLRAEKAERLRKKEREVSRAARESMKGLRELLSEAQDAVNAYIRQRDKDENCIACGDPFEPNRPGGSMDAGHFRARSVAPQLRFHEDNIFGQHKNCNRPGGTTYVQFRAGAVGRIGLLRVLAIEEDNTVHKWQKDEVREIRDRYRAKLKELKAKETA